MDKFITTLQEILQEAKNMSNIQNLVNSLEFQTNDTNISQKIDSIIVFCDDLIDLLEKGRNKYTAIKEMIRSDPMLNATLNAEEVNSASDFYR